MASTLFRHVKLIGSDHGGPAKNRYIICPFNGDFYPARHSICKSSHRHSSSGPWYTQNPLFRYLKSLKWVPIPLGVGFAYICYQQFRHVKEREQDKIRHTRDPKDLLAKDYQVTIYRSLPLNVISRLWGRINSLNVPQWMREPFYNLYIRAFDCNLDEAAIKDLKHYNNLGEFFRRKLRRGVRPVDKEYCVTCPSDGKILYLGKSTNGLVEQIKGITYPISGFLGPVSWKQKNKEAKGDGPIKSDDTSTKHHHQPSGTLHTSPQNSTYENSLKMEADTDLYHCVIYLAPGDYHGYHSPADWTITHRRHFPGDLLSVNPVIAGWVRGLFNYNERVVYCGEWQHGFFSMTPVGATNVGSIKVYHDKDLVTNCGCKQEAGAYYDASYVTSEERGIPFTKGEHFGEFNLGSTIVLIFEAPKTFAFNVKPGDKVKYGQPLGDSKCPEKTNRQEKQG